MLINQTILMAEDDPDDVMLIQRAFQKAGMGKLLQIVRDGGQAINYLSGKAEYKDRGHHPMPFLMLLDLKMPGTNGFEVLQWIRTQPELRRLLVVVLTSSNLQTDVDKAYELGANSYLVKPVEFAELVNLLQRFEVYWSEINRTPSATLETKQLRTETTLG